MRKIIVLDDEGLGSEPLGWEALAELGETRQYRQTPRELVAGRIGESEIVLTNKAVIDRAIMDACPGMKYIGVLSTRYNVVDIEAAQERGIVVTNIPAYSTYAVVQHSIALLLEVCNHVHLHHEAVKAGRWENSPKYCFWEKPLIELAHKTMGILGLGAIGQGMARAAQALGMQVIAHTRTPKNLPGVQEVSLEELLARSDVLSIHCPLTQQTEGMIAKKQIALMREGAILINTASGKIVREEDVLAALEEGGLGFYLADVMASEPPCKGDRLAHHERSILTPHLAWSPIETRRRLVKIAVSNVREYLRGNIQNSVISQRDLAMAKNDK